MKQPFHIPWQKQRHPLLALRPTIRRILYINTYTVSLYYLHNKHLETIPLTHHPSAEQTWRSHLQKYPDLATYILLDLAEETIRTETIPHVSRRDRQAIIERKRLALFPSAAFFHAEIQGQMQSDQSEDLLLCTGINDDTLIMPWLRALIEQRTPILGISSVPLLIRHLCADLIASPDEKTLFINLHNTCGLRQTLVQDKCLILSRLVKLTQHTPDHKLGTVTTEIDKLYHYIKGVGLYKEDTPFDIYFLTENPVPAAWKQTLTAATSMRYHFLTTCELAQRMGQKNIAPISVSSFFAQYLLCHPLPNTYADRKKLTPANLLQIQRIIYAFMPVLFVITILYSGINIWRATNWRTQSEALDARIKEHPALHETPSDESPQLLPVADIKRILTDLDKLARSRNLPDKMLSILGETLSRFPQIRLQELDWSTGKQDNTLKSIYENNQQTLTLKATLEPFSGDTREAINLINQFAEALREHAKISQVTLLRLPLDLLAETHTRGDVDMVLIPEFSLLAIMEHHL